MVTRDAEAARKVLAGSDWRHAITLDLAGENGGRRSTAGRGVSEGPERC